LGADVHLARALAIALLVTVAGCASRASRAMVTCSPPECPYPTSLALVAEVAPPAQGPDVRQEITSISINPKTGLFTVQLDAPVTLSGKVTITSAGTSKPVPVAATIVAARPSRISGRPDVYYQTATDPSTGAYQLAVSPNVADQYVLRVTPSDPTQVPPLQEMVTATGNQQLDFTYSDPLVLPELHGIITDSLLNRVDGMQVRAVDGNGVVVSTTVVTDPTGTYSLRLLASRPSTVTLTATQAPLPSNAPAPAPGPPPVPSLSRLVTMVDGMTFGSSVEANMELPPLPTAAHFSYGIASPSLSGARTPVVGATCVFSADVSDPKSVDGVTATFTATAVTDAVGNAAVWLVPGANGNRSYGVSITPDPSSPFQPLTTMIEVAPGGGYMTIMGLAIRPQLYGRVHDPTYAPLPGVTIAPMPSTLGAAAAAPDNLLRTLPTSAPPAMSGLDGTFSLRLDPAQWDVGLIPPADAMLPRVWLPGTNVIANTDLGERIIPRGVMVHGVVRDAANRPVPVADVLIYTVAPGNASCATGDLSCLAPARLRAEGPTDANGAVGIILPNQPTD
jgi:hypothetical protein